MTDLIIFFLVFFIKKHKTRTGNEFVDIFTTNFPNKACCEVKNSIFFRITIIKNKIIYYTEEENQMFLRSL